MKLNVSIVTYHTDATELHTCLACLLGSTAVSRVDIIDNGREERLRQLAESYRTPRLTYTPADNRGYGAGNNISLRRSLEEKADYHLVMNSDVYFKPDTIEKCLAYMDTHPECGQLIPRTVFPDGSYQPVCHPLPSPMDLLKHRFLPRKFGRRWRDSYEMRDIRLTEPLNVPYHHGCFMLFRTQALRDVGLFDERFFMYPEDIDITRRVHERYETVYFPGAEIVHAHRADSRRNYRMLWIHASNMLRYFRKWGFVFDKKRRRANEALRRRIQKL